MVYIRKKEQYIVTVNFLPKMLNAGNQEGQEKYIITEKIN